MKKMKDNAIFGDTGRIDKEIDVAGTVKALGQGAVRPTVLPTVEPSRDG